MTRLSSMVNAVMTLLMMSGLHGC